MCCVFYLFYFYFVELTPCGLLSPPTNTSIEYKRSEELITATYVCVDRLSYINGSDTLTCQNSTWVGTVGTCGKSSMYDFLYGIYVGMINPFLTALIQNVFMNISFRVSYKVRSQVFKLRSFSLQQWNL